jgi:hypothetical protein
MPVGSAAVYATPPGCRLWSRRELPSTEGQLLAHGHPTLPDGVRWSPHRLALTRLWVSFASKLGDGDGRGCG